MRKLQLLCALAALGASLPPAPSFAGPWCDSSSAKTSGTAPFPIAMMDW